MLLILATAFLLFYTLLIFYYFYHWLHIKEFSTIDNVSVFISVIVAARNEEKAIPGLLHSLNEQTYPKDLFEVIVVDDFSADKTSEVIQSFLNKQIHLIQPDSEPSISSKKKAIDSGIRIAKGDLVVITDADCIPGKNWLKSIASFYQKKRPAFIAAPVKLKVNSSLLSIFQSLDFITLQGITAASVSANMHSMCNGANLAYLRSAYFEVDGFKGIDKLASGDDMLLMYKIWKRHPQKVQYLKSEEAIVETEPMPTWKSFIAQRIRWSSKATYYKDWRITLVLLFIYLFNCLFLILFIAAFFDAFYWWVLFFCLVGKTLIELPFVYSVSKFYNQGSLIFFFPFLQPLHIFYTIIIGLISQFGTYEWKDRITK